MLTSTRLQAITPAVAHRYQLFLARGAVLVGDPEATESEGVEWISMQQVLELAAQGLVPDGG